MASNPLGGLQWQSTWGTNAVPTRSALRQYAAQKAQAEARAAAEAQARSTPSALINFGLDALSGGHSSPGPQYSGSPAGSTPGDGPFSGFNVNPNSMANNISRVSNVLGFHPAVTGIAQQMGISMTNASPMAKKDAAMDAAESTALGWGLSALTKSNPLAMIGYQLAKQFMPARWTVKSMRDQEPVETREAVVSPLSFAEMEAATEADEAEAAQARKALAPKAEDPAAPPDNPFGLTKTQETSMRAAIAKDIADRAAAAKAAAAAATSTLGAGYGRTGNGGFGRSGPGGGYGGTHGGGVGGGIGTSAGGLGGLGGVGASGVGSAGFSGAASNAGRSMGSYGGGTGGSRGSDGPDGDKRGGLVEIKKSKSGALSRVRNKR